MFYDFLPFFRICTIGKFTWLPSNPNSSNSMIVCEWILFRIFLDLPYLCIFSFIITYQGMLKRQVRNIVGKMLRHPKLCDIFVNITIVFSNDCCSFIFRVLKSCFTHLIHKYFETLLTFKRQFDFI